MEIQNREMHRVVSTCIIHKEEVNLEIGKVAYLLDMAFIRPDNIPVVTLSFYAPWKAGEVKLEDSENIEFAWVSYEEARNYDLIGGILEELEMVEKLLLGGDPSAMKF